MNRVEKYAEMLAEHPGYLQAAAIGLIQYAATSDDDAEAMAEVRDVLAALALAGERYRAGLSASIAEAKLDGGAS